MFKFIMEKYVRPSPMDVMRKELLTAHFAKLEAETGVDYARSVVEYNEARIARLNAHIDEYLKSQAQSDKLAIKDQINV